MKKGKPKLYVRVMETNSESGLNIGLNPEF